jgi:NAD(P)-dependent dehydrogenase (short-subunit alcohol dehydrogenase family)
LKLTLEDVDAFAAASHDVNPLHVSRTYARKTPYGERVVHGVLGALGCFGGLGPRPGQELAKISLDFSSPMFAGVPYEPKVEGSGQKVKLRLSDGRRVLLKMSATFRSATASVPAPARAFTPRSESVDREESSFTPGLEVAGAYGLSPEAAASLVERLGLRVAGMRFPHVAALACASYVVGMELPGTRALFTSVQLEFAEGLPDDAGAVYDFKAVVDSFDDRFGVLTYALTLSVEDRPIAAGTVKAMLRARHRAAVDLRTLLPDSDHLKGRVALITGASRGFGAVMAEALARQGCTVLGSYVESSADMDALSRRLEGRLIPTRGDAGDPTWAASARRLADEHGGLDILVLNASPALQPLAAEPASVDRIAAFVNKSFALASVPLAHFLDGLHERRGKLVVVSSIYVETIPKTWPHYIAAKGAIEGYARAAVAGYPNVSLTILRPPRMATDFSDGGIDAGEAPEVVAADAVRQLLETKS